MVKIVQHSPANSKSSSCASNTVIVQPSRYLLVRFDNCRCSNYRSASAHCRNSGQCLPTYFHSKPCMKLKACTAMYCGKYNEQYYMNNVCYAALLTHLGDFHWLSSNRTWVIIIVKMWICGAPVKAVTLSRMFKPWLRRADENPNVRNDYLLLPGYFHTDSMMLMLHGYFNIIIITSVPEC